MVLEVNNTFDERRMYFLRASDRMDDAPNAHANNFSPSSGSTISDSSPSSKGISNPSGKFTQSWMKDFHVSPFNSRKGSYNLTAHDPLFPYMSGKGPVDNTIVLNSSKSHAKLVARVYSTQGSVDPTTLTVPELAGFVLSWWWVGLITFPRIVKEAGKLFFQRKLHIWYRPEVQRDSIARRETEDERCVLRHCWYCEIGP